MSIPAPLVPHKVKTTFIDQNVKPELMRVAGAWPREMKVFQKLCERYPDGEFWSGFSTGFLVNSLAFFLTDKGATMLGDAYRLYTFHKAQQNSLDTTAKPNTFVVDIEEPPVAKPKSDALSWADSI